MFNGKGISSCTSVGHAGAFVPGMYRGYCLLGIWLSLPQCGIECVGIEFPVFFGRVIDVFVALFRLAFMQHSKRMVISGVIG